MDRWILRPSIRATEYTVSCFHCTEKSMAVTLEALVKLATYSNGLSKVMEINLFTIIKFVLHPTKTDNIAELHRYE